jgi:hypothetical protein
MLQARIRPADVPGYPNAVHGPQDRANPPLRRSAHWAISSGAGWRIGKNRTCETPGSAMLTGVDNVPRTGYLRGLE